MKTRNPTPRPAPRGLNQPALAFIVRLTVLGLGLGNSRGGETCCPLHPIGFPTSKFGRVTQIPPLIAAGQMSCVSEDRGPGVKGALLHPGRQWGDAIAW